MTFSSVLLVDDDEDDVRLTRTLLEEAAGERVSLEWAPTYDRGLSSLLGGAYDIALIDYRLGKDTGVGLLRAARAQGCTTPLIMLTGDTDGHVDHEAMEAGADDYLIKGQVTAPLLERSLRYAVEHRRVLDLLKEREAHLRAVIENSSDVIALLDPEGTVLFVSNAIEAHVGYPASQIVGRSTFDLIHPDDQPRIREASERCLAAAGNRIHAEYRARHRDGTWRDWEMIAVNRLDNPAVRAIILNSRDITERKRRGRELQIATDRLRALLSSAPIALWALDRAGIITLSEGRLLRQMNIRPGELVGQSQFDVYREHPEIIEVTHRALRGDSINTLSHLAGIILDTWYSPLHDAEGRLVGTLGVAIDVTERHRLEAQSRQAFKMEAIGHLAGGVAHDFNNLLTAILGFAEMALNQLPSSGQLRDDVQQILRAGHSAASLTRQLLAFSRQQILEPKVLDLNSVVGDMQALLHRVIGEDIALVTAVTIPVSRIHADQGQLEQVIMNLAVNARDAIVGTGTLRLATRNVVVDEAFVAAHRGATTGHYVRLTVCDTGDGMGPEVLSHLFEPFYTTKPPGKGTGLGLATVYGIVKQSGGYIWVDSTPGQGTSFMIDFPSVGLEPGSRATPMPGPGITAGTETILVVEDQREMRDVVRQTLQRRGYHVIEAVDGPTALALLHTHTGIVHLLLTDVVMPHMSGRELADAVATQGRSMRVLYMSGYTDDAIVRHGVLEPGIAFIHKPFMPDQLLARVREVLGA